MNCKGLSIALGGGLLVLTLLPGLAMADVMNYPGSICEPEGRDNVGYIARNYQGTFNYHYQQTDRKVVCPVVRKNPYTTSGARSIRVRIKRQSGAGSRAVSCEAVARDVRGREVSSSGTRSTTQYGNSELYFTLGQSAYLGSFEVRCTLPYESGVLGYSVSEY